MSMGVMIILANPIYDSVFKVLLDDFEVARGILSALIGMKIVDLRLLPQEYVRKDAATGELLVLRMDFCALIETEDGRRYQVIIELQKTRLISVPARFRFYLANRYMAMEEVQIDGRNQPASLPIISIYLLGYLFDPKLPMVTHVARNYYDAVTKKRINKGVPNDFIEQLTHDAFFIQIPKITGKMCTEMERVLSVFDQHRMVAGDKHRLEFDSNLMNSDPLVGKIRRILNRLQESPDMEKLMTLEDVLLFEQKQAVEEVRIELERELKKERALREKEQRKREKEQRIREEAQRIQQEEQQKRLAAESEVARLRKLLESGE